MKYKASFKGIDIDYFHYLAQENIFTILFGHKPKGYKKSSYIWNALLNQYIKKE